MDAAGNDHPAVGDLFGIRVHAYPRISPIKFVLIPVCASRTRDFLVCIDDDAACPPRLNEIRSAARSRELM